MYKLIIFHWHLDQRIEPCIFGVKENLGEIQWRFRFLANPNVSITRQYILASKSKPFCIFCIFWPRKKLGERIERQPKNWKIISFYYFFSDTFNKFTNFFWLRRKVNKFSPTFERISEETIRFTDVGKGKNFEEKIADLSES